jgi:hypothetical protein
MKKLLLSVFMVGASFGMFAQTDIFMSEYVEGSGNNKAIELYNPTSSTIDLTPYILVRFSNGENYPANLNPKTTSGGYLDLKGSIAPGECFVIVNGQTEDTEQSPKCDPALQALADQLDGDYPAPTYMNGNDAMAIMKSDGNGGWIPVDIFGAFGLASAMKNGYGWSDVKDATVTYTVNEKEVTATIKDYIVPLTANDGTTFGPYWMAWSKDHSLIRKYSVKQGVTTNTVPFNIGLEWDTLPAVHVGDTMWSQKDIWTNLGKHMDDSYVSQNTTKEEMLSVYPNPTTNGIVEVTCSKTIKSIEIYNLIGKLIATEDFVSAKKHQLILDNVNGGIYIVKAILEDNSSKAQRIIIK